jgi:hypothetical protein
MPITLFNPPCPHADPTRAGLQQNGATCGRCICTPRYWELISAPPDSADDTVKAMFTGPVRLSRDLSTFPTDVNARCQWAATIDLTGIGPGGVGIWQVYWGSIGSALQATGWIVQIDTHTGDPSTDATAAYIIPDTGVVEGIDGGFFKCLSENTFDLLIPAPVSVGFNAVPASIVIRPFWA